MDQNCLAPKETLSMRALPDVWISSLLVSALAALALGGCSAEAGTAATVATASSGVTEAVTTVEPAAEAPAGHPHGGHPGPDFLLFAALHESIDLTADQEKAIRALLPAAAAGPHPFDEARAATLAAGVRAGQVDVTSTEPAESDFATRHAATASALRTLHATLTAPQRRALIDAVEKRDAERASHDHGGPHDAPMGHEGGRGPLDHLLEGVDLTWAQRQEIAAKLDAVRPAPPAEGDRAAWKTEHEALRAAMQATLETFAAESFDAAAFVAPPAGLKKAADHPDPFRTEVAIVTSVLDATQREKLAQRIEAGPAAHSPPAP